MKQNFQIKVWEWLNTCFGSKIAENKNERNRRFLEESLELVQACGCSKEEVLKLVDYVYGRPSGNVTQEVGGVMITLASLCQSHEVDMMGEANVELKRVWQHMDKIKVKHLTKPL